MVPEEMQELEADALFGMLWDMHFFEAMSDVDFAHGFEAFVPGVREVAE